MGNHPCDLWVIQIEKEMTAFAGLSEQVVGDVEDQRANRACGRILGLCQVSSGPGKAACDRSLIIEQ